MANDRSENIFNNSTSDKTRLLFTAKEYWQALERYEEHGETNAPGFLCVVDVGTGDIYFEPDEVPDEDNR